MLVLGVIKNLSVRTPVKCFCVVSRLVKKSQNGRIVDFFDFFTHRVLYYVYVYTYMYMYMYMYIHICI